MGKLWVNGMRNQFVQDRVFRQTLKQRHPFLLEVLYKDPYVYIYLCLSDVRHHVGVALEEQGTNRLFSSHPRSPTHSIPSRCRSVELHLDSLFGTYS